MAAKKKILPRPCPLCGKKNGTVQIVIFSTSMEVICRIAHYDSEKYQNPSSVREKRSRGKKWCSFKIQKLFAEENMPPLEQDMDDLHSGYFGKRKSITYTNHSFLLDAVKENGWHGEGEKYMRAVAKRLGIWKKFLDTPGFNGSEQQLKSLLNHYAPNEKL